MKFKGDLKSLVMKGLLSKKIREVFEAIQVEIDTDNQADIIIRINGTIGKVDLNGLLRADNKLHTAQLNAIAEQEDKDGKNKALFRFEANEVGDLNLIIRGTEKGKMIFNSSTTISGSLRPGTHKRQKGSNENKQSAK